ncbi:MAG: IS5/IS1182 family transposase, partial [Treponema sp.]|nr:IS5/IS1182 family transposase [Treponema sp.]
CENGGKWRSLPETFGDWQVISVRLSRWAEKGCTGAVFCGAVRGKIAGIRGYCLDSMIVKTYPDAHGARKNGPQAAGKSRGGWNTKIHALTWGIGS